MGSPFRINALGGVLGSRTASFFRLDPTGTVPIEPLVDLIPAITPNRVVLDMIDDEAWIQQYDVTENPMQDFSDATTNNRKRLQEMTITGTLTSALAIPLVGSIGAFSISGVRFDFLKLANLEQIADRKEPILVTTPRRSMAKAFITSISPPWNPEDGNNTIVTITLREARIVNPLIALSAIADVAESTTGNNAATNVGAQAPEPVGAVPTLSPIPGVAPSLAPF